MDALGQNDPNSTRSLLSSIKSFLSPSDDQLMWRVQMHDDSQAFAELVNRWEAPIRRLCARMTGDAHRAEDLAQESFSRLFSRRKVYKAEARLSTFLWRVALNLCYDELRRVQRRGESSLDDETNPLSAVEFSAIDPAPDSALMQEERARIVRDALMQLPDTLRAVVILRHYENLKFREVAHVLGLPEGTVKSRMAEALDRLHRILERTLEDPISKARNEHRERPVRPQSGPREPSRTAETVSKRWIPPVPVSISALRTWINQGLV